MFTSGVRAHLVASRFAAPLMIERGSGLIISTIAWSYGEYMGNLIYDTAKGAIVPMAFGMAEELRPHGVRRSRSPPVGCAPKGSWPPTRSSPST
jgi:NAD(P)-dependent dehydrogenase (short-subunit alcohol dehydrogenase family)